MTGRSQNFRLLEITKMENAKDPSKLDNEQPRAYPEHRRWSAVTSTSLAYGLPIIHYQMRSQFPGKRKTCREDKDGLHDGCIAN